MENMRTIRMALVTWLVAVATLPAGGWAQQALERSTPEAQGVVSQGVVGFLDAVAEAGLELHSLMLLRNGKVVAEGWWQPYGPELRHVMFSASKSVTALGIGMAVDEGRFGLDDRVVSFFPEHVTDSVSPAMRELTVRHLLTMSVGQAQDPSGAAMRGEADWARVFLHAPPVHEPGAVFMYNNLATFMLSAIVQKATGERLFDYLEPRLFQALGIQDITWDHNRQGITVGMIGARLRTEDLAKIGQLFLRRGEWNGERLVSAAYVEDAGAFHITTRPDTVPAGEANDGQMGYGYQLWRGSHNSYRLDGMGGQLAIVLPDHDAVVVVTANVRSSLDVLRLVSEHLVPALRDAPLPADPAAQTRLATRLAALGITPATHTGSGLLPAAAGKRFVLEANPQGVRAVTFVVQDDRCVVTLDLAGGTRTLEAGLGGWRPARLPATSLAGEPPAGGYPRSSNHAGADPTTAAALSCGMRDDGSLELTARFLEDGLGAESWTAEFQDLGAAGVGVSITTGAGRMGGPPPVLRGQAGAGAR
jgi:CubicO group peptidase (beta-lactamase class C family)